MANGALIGEAIIVVLQALMLWYKEKGYSDEECRELMREAMKRVEATKPEDLPNV